MIPIADDLKEICFGCVTAAITFCILFALGLLINQVYEQEAGWDTSQIGIQGPAEDMVPRRYNVVAPFQDLPVEIVKQFAQLAAVPASLMLFNLTGNLNAGMCTRTAAVFGFENVYIVGKKRYDARSAVGAKNYIQIERFSDLTDDPVSWFESRGLTAILIEQGGQSLSNVRFVPMCKDKHVVFIVGSESDGIPPAVLHALRAAPRITIQQPGLIRSLNVSTAAGIVLAEYTRQTTAHAKARLGLD